VVVKPSGGIAGMVAKRKGMPKKVAGAELEFVISFLKDNHQKMTGAAMATHLGYSCAFICETMKENGIKVPDKVSWAAISAANKGKPSHRKGKKRSKWMNPLAIKVLEAFQFKKGCVPANAKKVGSLTIKKITAVNGKEYKYRYVRKAKGWTPEHILNWEREYGPIPEGYRIGFKDDNTLNTDPSNLKLVLKREALLKVSASMRLTDGFIAHILTWRNPDLKSAVIADKKLIDMKRQQIILSRFVNQFK
jgi:hypothetical protein